MINQKLFTIIGQGSRTTVRAALLSEIYPLEGSHDFLSVTGVTILEGKLSGALLTVDAFSMSVPAVLEGSLVEVSLPIVDEIGSMMMTVPAVLEGLLKDIVITESFEDSITVTGVTILSGNLNEIVIRFNENSDALSVSGVTILSGSLV